MQICFPITKDEGMNSIVYDHFGSAPVFAVVDTDVNSITMIDNPDSRHTQGEWSPLKALNNQKIDAIVVAGIGAGAIAGLNQKGIKVYRSQGATIRENMTMIKNGTLSNVTSEQCCSGHSADGGCAH
jgi:predicted Fe-Mo cluster-binding NifX family protein